MKNAILAIVVLFAQSGFAQQPIVVEKSTQPEKIFFDLVFAGKMKKADNRNFHGIGTQIMSRVFRSGGPGTPKVQLYAVANDNSTVRNNWNCFVRVFDAYGVQVVNQEISVAQFNELNSETLDRASAENPVSVEVDLKSAKILKISEGQNMNDRYAAPVGGNAAVRASGSN